LEAKVMASNLLRDLLDPTDSTLLAELMRGSPMTSVMVNEDHTIVAVEGGNLLEQLGYPWPSDVIGQKVEIFLPPDKRESHKGWFDGWINHPQERPLRDAQPMTVQKNEGGTLTVRISIKKVYLPDGARLGKDYEGRPFRGGVAYVFVDI
jgi:hypothetical protein